MRRHVSHHDRCRLEAIERRLESVDPRLAERFLVGSLIPLLLGALAWRNSRRYGQAGWSVELLHRCAECS